MGELLGIGLDLVEIDRFRASVERHGKPFLDRLFTAAEQSYCATLADPIPSYAARFAAKEAVSKAFGTGIGADLSWQDIEIVHDTRKAPSIVLHGNGLTLLQSLNATRCLITLTHTATTAAATAALIR
jgi:holo-[acyl-carrier protein] synthase